jgi:phospholipase/carboxylesterase
VPARRPDHTWCGLPQNAPREVGSPNRDTRGQDVRLTVAAAGSEGQVALAANLALQACAGLRAAPQADNPMMQAYRAMRQYSRSLEALAALAETVPAVGRYLLEPQFRDDPALMLRLAKPPHPDSGASHFDNQTDQRGGFSVYVPPWYDSSKPTPLVMALHGGSGHGRLFLWNWLPEVRSRCLLVVGPTAIGSTRSLMEPEIDSQNLGAILARARSVEHRPWPHAADGHE